MSEDNIKVPLRQVESYQTDDGRKVEIYTKIDEVDFKTAEQDNTNDKETNFNQKEKVYVGMATIGLPMGSHEIRFEMQVDSVKEAFDRFYEFASPAAEEFVKEFVEMQREAQRQSQNKIVGAPAGMAEQFKNKEEGNIITP